LAGEVTSTLAGDAAETGLHFPVCKSLMIEIGDKSSLAPFLAVFTHQLVDFRLFLAFLSVFLAASRNASNSVVASSPELILNAGPAGKN